MAACAHDGETPNFCLMSLTLISLGTMTFSLRISGSVVSIRVPPCVEGILKNRVCWEKGWVEMGK